MYFLFDKFNINFDKENEIFVENSRRGFQISGIKYCQNYVTDK